MMLGSPEAGSAAEPARPIGRVYTNDHFVQGLGYYHAPYRNWFAYPYNYFDTNRGQYFHGGNWSEKPHESITNLSSSLRPPPPTVVPVAATRPSSSHISRNGFGSSSYGSTRIGS